MGKSIAFLFFSLLFNHGSWFGIKKQFAFNKTLRLLIALVVDGEDRARQSKTVLGECQIIFSCVIVSRWKFENCLLEIRINYYSTTIVVAAADFTSTSRAKPTALRLLRVEPFYLSLLCLNVVYTETAKRENKQ